MPAFNKGPNFRTPFGRNQFLRSTEDLKTESYTVSASATATEVIDGFVQKILQPGEVMAKITSGTEVGKVGPYDINASDGRQTTANIVGINNTFLPWQLYQTGTVNTGRDVEIAVVKEARVVQPWCFERVSGVRTALGDTTAAQMTSGKDLRIMFAAVPIVVS